jgi:hypothetical protein
MMAAHCGLYLTTQRRDSGARVTRRPHEEHPMKVSDILRVKGNTLFTVTRRTLARP